MSKKGPTEDFLFSFLQTSFFFSQNGQYLPTKQKEKEKKKTCGHPTGHNYGHPLDRKTFFFFSKMDNIFLPNKKKRKKTTNLRPPDWPQLQPPAGQETDFFLLTA